MNGIRVWRRLTPEKEGKGMVVLNRAHPSSCFEGVEAERMVHCGNTRGKKEITTGGPWLSTIYQGSPIRS